MQESANYDANWHYPTEVFFGVDELKNLNNHLQQINCKHPMFVVDAVLLDQPAVADVLSTLRIHHNSIFSDFKGNPTASNVIDGVACYQQQAHDCVVAIGGGSAIDAAKTIALLAHQKRPLWDFIDDGDNYRRADASCIPPIIAAPTTAGTGAEVGRAAVILDQDTQQKKIIFHPKMMPLRVIADPVLSLSLPAHLTAATGMDALAHNLEALCAPGFHPMADGIAIEGLRLIHQWLPVAVADGQNIDARSHMLAASLMGATAFQKGLGAVHSLSHPVGGEYDAHHGLLNAIFMPYVLLYNRPKIELKMQRLARYLSLPQQTFDGVLDWLLELCQQIHIPNNLKAINIDGRCADIIAQRALADPSTLSNPVDLSIESLKAIYLAAIDGDMTIVTNTLRGA